MGVLNWDQGLDVCHQREYEVMDEIPQKYSMQYEDIVIGGKFRQSVIVNGLG